MFCLIPVRARRSSKKCKIFSTPDFTPEDYPGKKKSMDKIAEKKKLLVRALVLPLLLLIHVAIGTCVFLHYEGRAETEKGILRLEEKEHLLSHTKNLTQDTMDAISALMKGECSKGHDTHATASWGFWDAFAFAFTIISTIGYGVVAPHDIEGRLFCIVYAFIGIPLMTLHLAIMNVIILQSINKLDSKLSHLKERLCIKTSMVFKISVISAAFVIFLILHFVIFWAIQHLRQASNTGFLDSIYFAVITYGTVGFGDITPQSMSFTETMEVFRVLVFASTGLALVSLCFSLYREAMNKSKRMIARRVSMMPAAQRLGDITEMLVARSRPSGSSSTLRPLGTLGRAASEPADRPPSAEPPKKWGKIRNISLAELKTQTSAVNGDYKRVETLPEQERSGEQ